MAPKLHSILETCIYVTDLEQTKNFYRDLLGIPVYSELEGRHVFFKLNYSILMTFIAEESQKGKTLPPHGAEGEIHLVNRE